MTVFLLFVLFQGAWFANVLGGADGLTWPGIVGSAILLGVLCIRDQPAAVLARALLGVVLGSLLDSALLALDWVQFPQHVGSWLPLWMLSLWACFAAALPLMTPFLAGRRPLAIAFGAVGGPAAYYSAQALGAVEVAGIMAYFGVAIAWATAMLVLPLRPGQAVPAAARPA